MMTASIAGMGWVTPLGRDLESVWKAICENKRPDTSRLENPISKRAVPVLRVPENLVRDTAALLDCAVPASSRTLQSPPRLMPPRPRE